MVETKEIARREIKNENFRIYIPPEVVEILDLKQFDEISFQYDGEDIIIRKNLVNRKTVKTISKIKT